MSIEYNSIDIITSPANIYDSHYWATGANAYLVTINNCYVNISLGTYIAAGGGAGGGVNESGSDGCTALVINSGITGTAITNLGYLIGGGGGGGGGGFSGGGGGAGGGGGGGSVGSNDEVTGGGGGGIGFNTISSSGGQYGGGGGGGGYDIAGGVGGDYNYSGVPGTGSYYGGGGGGGGAGYISSNGTSGGNAIDNGGGFGGNGGNGGGGAGGGGAGGGAGGNGGGGYNGGGVGGAGGGGSGGGLGGSTTYSGGNGGYGLYNNSDTNLTLTNAQGITPYSGSTYYGPLYISGAYLPQNYFIYITSQSIYGQLFIGPATKQFSGNTIANFSISENCYSYIASNFTSIGTQYLISDVFYNNNCGNDNIFIANYPSSSNPYYFGYNGYRYSYYLTGGQITSGLIGTTEGGGINLSITCVGIGTVYTNNAIYPSETLSLYGNLQINPSCSNTIIGIQFGSVTGSGSNIYTAFPKPFPTSNVIVNATSISNQTNNILVPQINLVSNTGFTWTAWYGGLNGSQWYTTGNYIINWIAICYE